MHRIRPRRMPSRRRLVKTTSLDDTLTFMNDLPIACTLTPDAETRLGPYLGPELTALTVMETTRLGRALRSAHLDELPQLYNVLGGTMSIVGPRPIRPAFFAELCEQIPQYWQRLVAPPGMTGFAQLRMTREMSLTSCSGSARPV